jgi:hypothetical protein
VYSHHQTTKRHMSKYLQISWSTMKQKAIDLKDICFGKITFAQQLIVCTIFFIKWCVNWNFVVYTCYVVLFWPFRTWVVPVFLLEYCIITLRICCLLLNLSFDVLSVICRLHNLSSPFKIPFYLVPPIVFSFMAHTFFYLGTIFRFSWNDTTGSHWRFHDNRRMNTSADVF